MELIIRYDPEADTPALKLREGSAADLARAKAEVVKLLLPRGNTITGGAQR